MICRTETVRIVELEFLRAHRRDHAPMWHAWVGAFLCPVLFSGCVELLQEYCTTYRGGDWLDFAANTTGAILASLVAYYVVRPRMKINSKRQPMNNKGER